MTKISPAFFTRFYPSSAHDGTAAFYKWIRTSINANTILLNLGAGPTPDNPVRRFRGDVSRTVGIDIDPAVLKNTDLDEAHVIDASGKFPLQDNSVDIIVSDFVLEHVEFPLIFLVEAQRVLRPGGSLYFRTPNQLHYVATIARITPHSFHLLIANKARGLPEHAHAPYPTFYRMNSRTKVARLAREAGFKSVEFRMWEAEPSYLAFSIPTFLLGVAYERLVNSSELFSVFRANIFGNLTK